MTLDKPGAVIVPEYMMGAVAYYSLCRRRSPSIESDSWLGLLRSCNFSTALEVFFVDSVFHACSVHVHSIMFTPLALQESRNQHDPSAIQQAILQARAA